MTERPIRLRLSRAKGFDLQAASRALNGLPALNVARPGSWGNPFVVGKHGTRADCVHQHAALMHGWLSLGTDDDCFAAQRAALAVARAEASRMAGQNVACWCDLKGPCHGDTLLALFNGWAITGPDLKGVDGSTVSLQGWLKARGGVDRDRRA